jgi:Uncharacterized protein conserved in bacteria (DUF2330)
MTRFALPLAGLLSLAVWLAALPADVWGCAAAPHPDERVDVSYEEAVIVWDEATKTEHFIRRATFQGDAYDFGFLVPTPNRPQLEEADGGMFGDLATLTAPKTVYETREVKEEVDFGCAKPTDRHETAGEALPAKAAGGVAVLEQKRVGDLDAAVLGFKPGAEASPEESAADLLAWLNRNGYAVRPDLIDWVKVYARDKWVITAYKIAGSAPTAEPPGAPAPPKGTKKEDGAKAPRRPVTLSSTTVRMSFKADRPFFPYREPAGQRDEQTQNTSRLLRVYVAAKQRMAGKLGDGAAAWPGRTVWADAIPGESRGGLLGKAKLPADTAPGGWWLTEFEDRSTPRPGTDEVYFEPAADQLPVARPPHIIPRYVRVRVYPEWFGPVVVLGPFTLLVAGILLVHRARLRKGATKAG